MLRKNRVALRDAAIYGGSQAVRHHALRRNQESERVCEANSSTLNFKAAPQLSEDCYTLLIPICKNRATDENPTAYGTPLAKASITQKSLKSRLTV